MEKKPAPTIRDLYPHFTDEQLAEAEDAHDRYLAIVLRIFAAPGVGSRSIDNRHG